MNKSDLKKYVSLMREAEELKAHIERLEEESKSLKAVAMDGMPKGTAVNDSIGDIVAKIEKCRAEYLHQYDLALCELYKIERVIKSLDESNERRLMRMRYIENRRWEDICVKLNYESAQVHRIHASALRKIRMIENDT